MCLSGSQCVFFSVTFPFRKNLSVVLTSFLAVTLDVVVVRRGVWLRGKNGNIFSDEFSSAVTKNCLAGPVVSHNDLRVKNKSARSLPISYITERTPSSSALTKPVLSSSSSIKAQ